MVYRLMPKKLEEMHRKAKECHRSGMDLHREKCRCSKTFVKQIREIRAHLWLIPFCLSFRNHQTAEGHDREMPGCIHGEWRGSNRLA